VLRPFVPNGDVNLFQVRAANPSLFGHHGSRKRSVKILKDKQDLLTDKLVKAKDNSEARQLSEASRNFLIYQRQHQSEDEPSQKIETSAKKARKNVKALHPKSYCVAIENDN
ncbi:MAG: hypothetical protein Q9191_005728, partial [Dirinaria sp. TL-2023a]